MARKRKKERRGGNFTTACIGGVMAGLLVGVALVFIMSAVAYRTSDPGSMLLPLGLISLGISGLVCGRIACVLWGHGSLIPALASGGAYAVLIALAGLIVPGSTLHVWVRCAGIPVVFLLALAGGAIGHRGRTRRRHRH